MRTIIERLRAAYGKPELEPHRAPVDELVLTVLSQNTNDRNRDVAYFRLRDRFPTWDAVREAPVDEVEDAMVAALAGRDAEDWAERGRRHRVPIVPVPSAAGILSHPIFTVRFTIARLPPRSRALTRSR